MLVGEVNDSTVRKGIYMEIAGIEQSAESSETAHLFKKAKNLLELQGEMVVQLLESAKVPSPADISVIRGLGARIDIHV